MICKACCKKGTIVGFKVKCKYAGLLDKTFQKMLDALHLVQDKLMDDNTLVAEYEEVVISILGCIACSEISLQIPILEQRTEFRNYWKQKSLNIHIDLKDLKVLLPAIEDAAFTTKCNSVLLNSYYIFKIILAQFCPCFINVAFWDNYLLNNLGQIPSFTFKFGLLF